MILLGSFVQINGFGFALVCAMKLWIASLSSWTEWTARLRLRLDNRAKKPSTALSQDAKIEEVEGKSGMTPCNCRQTADLGQLELVQPVIPKSPAMG
jgi:hypothetical protein